MENINTPIVTQSIIDQTFMEDWLFYLVFFLLSLLGSFFGAFISSYGKEKAKYAAIEASLESIKKQVSETTKISEKIKSEIELDSWRTKEREARRRGKLEDYITTIYLANRNVHLEMQNKLFAKGNDYDEGAWHKADMLQALYFPELSDEHNQFRVALIAYQTWLSEGMKEISSGDMKSASREHMDSYSEILLSFNPALLAIDEKAKGIARAINN
jgi:hypothetical protein